MTTVKSSRAGFQAVKSYECGESCKYFFLDDPLLSFFIPFQKYRDVEGMVKIEEVKGEQLVKAFAEEMEEMLGRKMKSVKVMRGQAEFHPLGD